MNITVGIQQETIQSRKHRLRWWTLLVLSVSLVLIAVDTTILNVAIPTLQQDLGASASGLHVDRIFVHTRIRRTAVDDGIPGRPIRQKAAVAIRNDRLRTLESGRRLCSEHGPAYRGAGLNGRWGRDDNARDPINHHRRLPARGAGQGHRHMECRRRHRRPPGHDCWRVDARKPVVGFRLFNKHPHRCYRARRWLLPGTG